MSNMDYTNGCLCPDCIITLGRRLKDKEGTTWSKGHCDFCKKDDVSIVSFGDTE